MAFSTHPCILNATPIISHFLLDVCILPCHHTYMQIIKASTLMTPENAARMAELKSEYSKLTTTPARMREIYAEMTRLRQQVEASH